MAPPYLNTENLAADKLCNENRKHLSAVKRLSIYLLSSGVVILLTGAGLTAYGAEEHNREMAAIDVRPPIGSANWTRTYETINAPAAMMSVEFSLVLASGFGVGGILLGLLLIGIGIEKITVAIALKKTPHPTPTPAPAPTWPSPTSVQPSVDVVADRSPPPYKDMAAKEEDKSSSSLA